MSRFPVDLPTGMNTSAIKNIDSTTHNCDFSYSLMLVIMEYEVDKKLLRPWEGVEEQILYETRKRI